MDLSLALSISCRCLGVRHFLSDWPCLCLRGQSRAPAREAWMPGLERHSFLSSYTCSRSNCVLQRSQRQPCSPLCKQAATAHTGPCKPSQVMMSLRYSAAAMAWCTPMRWCQPQAQGRTIKATSRLPNASVLQLQVSYTLYTVH